MKKSHPFLQELISHTVKSELKKILSEQAEENSVVETKKFHEGDPVSHEMLEKVFKIFHFSIKNIGITPIFKPKVPRYPWKPIEDDFTNRISLANSIQDAKNAVDEHREFLYAGDIKTITTDDIETIDTSETFTKCPSSPMNNYGEHFDMVSWLTAYNAEIVKKHNGEYSKEQEEMEKIISRATRRRKYFHGPKDLPEFLRKKFFACVPDAQETGELWSTAPVKLTLVALQAPNLTLTKEGADIMNKFYSTK